VILDVVYNQRRWEPSRPMLSSRASTIIAIPVDAGDPLHYLDFTVTGTAQPGASVGARLIWTRSLLVTAFARRLVSSSISLALAREF